MTRFGVDLGPGLGKRSCSNLYVLLACCLEGRLAGRRDSKVLFKSVFLPYGRQVHDFFQKRWTSLPSSERTIFHVLRSNRLGGIAKCDLVGCAMELARVEKGRGRSAFFSHVPF